MEKIFINIGKEILKNFVIKNAKKYFEEKKWEDNLNNICLEFISDTKNTELLEASIDGISKATEELLGFSVISSAQIDSLFEEYYDNNNIDFNKSEIKRNFEIYMKKIDQIVYNELNMAERLLFKSINRRADLLDKKISNKTNCISKGIQEIKLENEKNTNRLNMILESLDHETEPLVTVDENQVINIKLNDENDTKLNILGNSIILSEESIEADFSGFIIEFLISNIGKVAIDSITLSNIRICFYEMLNDDPQAYYYYQIAYYEESYQIYKTIFPNCTAKLRVCMNDNKIEDEIFYEFIDSNDYEQKYDDSLYLYRKYIRNKLNEFNEIIIEFNINVQSLNGSTDYKFELFLTRISNMKEYLEGKYKIENVIVNILK